MNDTITIKKGRAVGLCDECGFLRDDQFEYEFPNSSSCGICGAEVRVAILSEDIEADPEEFA